jgi:outer membrane autotransporter protein
LNLNVDSQDTESLQGYIGGRLYYRWDTGTSSVMPGIHASYGHEFLRGSQSVTSRLAQGSSPFSIETQSPDKNFFLGGAGLSMFLSSGASFHLGYNVQITMDKYIAHGIKGIARLSF